MEKWMVVVGIWVMAATCAVLFIRGATISSARRSSKGQRARGATASDAPAVVKD